MGRLGEGVMGRIEKKRTENGKRRMVNEEKIE
jgi:hypothetical protein